MNAGPRKFTFENSFDSGGQPVHRAQPKQKKFFTPEELEAAKSQAFAEGRASAEARAAQVQAMALSRVAEAVMRGLDEMDQIAREAKEGAALVAHAAARALGGAALKRFPVDTIEETLVRCLAQIPQEPRVVVHIDVDLVAALRERIGALAAEIGFDGRIVIAGEAGMSGADCRFEWAEGGARRDTAEIEIAVGEAVARFAETVHGSDGGHAR
jgi:flagellar assembly protein FliH